jgi:hypothetical protein
VEKQPLHLKVQSGSKETLVSTLGNMIRDNFSEDLAILAISRHIRLVVHSRE